MTRFPSSRHFKLQELSEGVYAAIHADGGWAVSNAGIVDLGDRTLVFDAFLSSKATEDLLTSARSLTGRPVHAVLNSHYHNDHIWGNQAVPFDTDIISTIKTRDLIAARGPKEVEWYREHAVQHLNEARLQFEHAPDSDAKAFAQYVVVYHEAIVDTIPTLQVRIPNMVFSDMLEFKGPKRSARFITYGAGHTASDAILYLPDDHILFLADLLFIGVHPYLADGDPKGLWQATAHIKDLQAGVLVPGHGPVGRPNDLDVMLQYINKLQGLVKQAVLDGITLEQVSLSTIPSAYRTWIFPSFYRENIRFLYQLYAPA